MRSAPLARESGTEEPAAAAPARADGGIGGVGRLIIAACGLIGVAIGFMLVEGEQFEPIMLGLLAMLAIVGVAMLLLLALGLVRIGVRTAAGDIPRSYLDSLTEGVLIADDAGRVVYANGAYRALTGSDGDEVRAVERVFAGDPTAAEAVYRVAQAAREGRAAERPGCWSN